MPFQPAPACASIAVVGSLNGEEIVNRFVFHNASSWGAGELAALALGMGTAWEDGVLPWLSHLYSLMRIEGRGLRSVGDVAADENYSPTPTGGNLGDCEDNALAACFKLATGLIGRSFRGRSYIGGLSANTLDNNRIALATLAGLNTGLNALVGTGSVSAGWSLVVLSRRTGGELRPFAVNTPVNLILSTSNVAASQRRRRPKRA